MAKIKVVGNVAVLESTIAYDDIVKVAKYRPEALYETDEDGNPVFGICVSGSARANASGINFNNKAHDENGSAIATFVIVDDAEEAEEFKAHLADRFGGAIMGLARFEENFKGVLEEIEKERADVLEHITLN